MFRKRYGTKTMNHDQMKIFGNKSELFQSKQKKLEGNSVVCSQINQRCVELKEGAGWRASSDP